jgi:hypothetical protein
MGSWLGLMDGWSFEGKMFFWGKSQTSDAHGRNTTWSGAGFWLVSVLQWVFERKPVGYKVCWPFDSLVSRFVGCLVL